MIDPNLIRENPEKIKQNTSERNINPEIVTQWIDVDKQRSKLIQEGDNLRRERNKLSEIKGRPDEATINEVKELKLKMDKFEEQIKKVEDNCNNLLNQIPNIHKASEKIGKNDKNIKVA